MITTAADANFVRVIVLHGVDPWFYPLSRLEFLDTWSNALSGFMNMCCEISECCARAVGHVTCFEELNNYRLPTQHSMHHVSFDLLKHIRFVYSIMFQYEQYWY